MTSATHSEGGKRHDRARLRRMWRRWLVSLLLAMPVVAPQADPANTPAESPQAIKETAQAFIVRQIARDFPHHEIAVSDLDPRLRLTACDAPLEGFLPPGGRLPGNTTIGIRCAGAKPWTVYVPAAVKGMRQVVVTKRPVLRGAAIGEGDIALEEREITGNNDAYIFDPANVLGKTVKRPLAAATALTPGMLDAPLLVRRGQQVIILAQGAGLEVRMNGTALTDGAEGQLVRAKTAHSQRTVEGLVIKPGVIRVNM